MVPSSSGKRLLLAVALAFSTAAHADIYTWTDEAGKVNVSNLPPPDGVRVTRVVRERPRPPVSEPRTDVVYQQQVLALSERVRQLESELQASAPAPMPPPTIVIAPVVNVTMPAPVQYEPVQEAAAAAQCDPSWYGCGAWWGTSFYPVYPASTVVVTRPIHSRRHHRFDGRVHPAPYQFGSVPLAPVGVVTPPVAYPGGPARPVAPVPHPGPRRGR